MREGGDGQVDPAKIHADRWCGENGETYGSCAFEIDAIESTVGTCYNLGDEKQNAECVGEV